MYEHYGKAMLKNDNNFFNFYNSKYNTNKMEKDVLINNNSNKNNINDELLKGQVDFSTNRQQKELFKNYIKFTKSGTSVINNNKFPMLRFNIKINEQELNRKIMREGDYMGRANN